MKLVYATALGRKKSGHSRQRQTLKSTSDHAPRGQTVRRFDWCCVAASECSAYRSNSPPESPWVSILSLGRASYGQRSRRKCPPRVEIDEGDRLNPKTLRLDSDRLDRSVRNERVGKVRAEPH